MARSLDSSSRNFVTKIFQRRVSSFEFPNKVCTPYHQPGLVPAPKSKVSKHGGENAKQRLASSFLHTCPPAGFRPGKEVFDWVSLVDRMHNQEVEGNGQLGIPCHQPDKV